jgi:CBS domain-containing protein
MNYMKNLSQLKAKDIMQHDVITLNPEMTLFDAAKVLRESDISGAPVVDETEQVIGVLSQSDLLRHSIEDEYSSCFKADFYHEVPFLNDVKFFSGTSMNSSKVSEIMSPYVITASPEDSIADVARSLREHRFHRLIITKENKLVGIISTLDLLKVLEDLG